MNIGVVGLGKVGLPLALVLRHHGRHNVIGYDKDPERVERYQKLYNESDHVHPERLVRELLAAGPIAVAPTMQTLVQYSDVVIVMVDTPHPPEYDTRQPLPDTRNDFDYTNLRTAVDEFMGQAIQQRKQIALIISSTVSPGTTQGLTVGHPGNVRVGYSPVLISLGSVAADLLSPDMVLAGSEDPEVWETIVQIWTPVLNSVPVMRLKLVEAEIVKLALNGYLSFKIAFSNILAQFADEYGGNVDRITHALRQSSAVTSSRYLHAGLSDAGACRPRDTIVLEEVSERSANINPELWWTLTRAREDHTRWLADQVEQLSRQYPLLPVWLCGTAYKPGVPYTDGSVALLLAAWLQGMGIQVEMWDPVVEGYVAAGMQVEPPTKALFVLACAHGQVVQFLASQSAPGSVIVDPTGHLTGLTRPGVALIQPGRRA